MFYVPMVLPPHSTRSQPDARCWFLFPKGPSFKFPHSMRLAKVPGVSGGIYNQWEFLLHLLAIEARSERWEIAECSYRQSSMHTFLLTGISEQLGRPGQPRAAPAASQPSASAGAGGIEPDFDVNFFDAPVFADSANFQLPGSSLFGLGGLADGADDDGVDQFIFEDEDDLIGDDIASDEDMQLKDLRAAPKASAARPMNPEDAQSESGRSAASRAASIGSHFKTVATDVEILKGCLGPLRHLADSCVCQF